MTENLVLQRILCISCFWRDRLCGSTADTAAPTCVSSVRFEELEGQLVGCGDVGARGGCQDGRVWRGRLGGARVDELHLARGKLGGAVAAGGPEVAAVDAARVQVEALSERCM